MVPKTFLLVKMSYNLPKYCVEVVDHAKHQFPNILISALRRPILEPFLFTVHLGSFWPLCTELMGIFKYPAWEKFPGEQHCKNPMAF